MLDDQFYVTLPSNVNDSIHLYNTMANFTTHLFKPLVFSVPYEVALAEITFPTPLVNKDVQIGTIVLQKYSETFVNKKKSLSTHKDLVETNFKMSDLKRDNFIDFLNGKLKEMADEIQCSPPPSFIKTAISERFYHVQICLSSKNHSHGCISFPSL